MQKHSVLFLLLILFSAVSLQAEAPPKVGVISGLSGAAAKWNRFQNMGIQLAQEELKGSGFPIEIVYEDSATNASKVISAYSKLVTFDRVDAVIANDFGFVVAPLLPIVAREKRFLVALSLPHERYCRQAVGYFYSATSQFSKTKEVFERFFSANPQVKKIGLVVFDDPEWGNTYREIWTAIAKSRGIEIVETFLSAELNPDFRAALTKMLPKKPDAIFLAHEPYSFLKTAKSLGYTGPVVSANNVLEILADSAEVELLEGVYLVDPQISPEFREKFQKRFNKYPILEAYAGYEALRSVANAFERDRNSPHIGMQNVRYPGVAGLIDYTGSSCAGNQSDWALFQFRNGAPVEIKG